MAFQGFLRMTRLALRQALESSSYPDCAFYTQRLVGYYSFLEGLGCAQDVARTATLRREK